MFEDGLPDKKTLSRFDGFLCRMANELDEPIPFIENLGKVEVLTCENNDFAGEWKSLGERMFESRRFTSRAVASRAE